MSITVSLASSGELAVTDEMLRNAFFWLCQGIMQSDWEQMLRQRPLRNTHAVPGLSPQSFETGIRHVAMETALKQSVFYFIFLNER